MNSNGANTSESAAAPPSLLKENVRPENQDQNTVHKNQSNADAISHWSSCTDSSGIFFLLLDFCNHSISHSQSLHYFIILYILLYTKKDYKFSNSLEK